MNLTRFLLIASVCVGLTTPITPVHADESIFARSNLVAWCIVPFDTKKRGPEERAMMLDRLGIKKLAYDWRAEHIPTFDSEVAAMNRHGVDLTAWWFPSSINSNAVTILDCIKRNNIHPQLWVCLEGGQHLRWNQAFESTPEAQEKHVARIVERVKPIAAEAAKLGCQVALYNHGGWAGVPENQMEIIDQLKKDGLTNVGMIYTQHHGHGEMDRFAELFPKMKPYLLAISLNGMITDGDLRDHNSGTAPVGQGDQDPRLLRIINESGWHGPVGIILEVFADAEVRLQDNLDGLDWLVAQLSGKPAGPKPQPRSWHQLPAVEKDAATPKEIGPFNGNPMFKASDPAVIVANNRVYLITCEGFAPQGDLWKEWRAWSSADLKHWTDHGVIFGTNNSTWGKKKAWATSIVQKNGYYYWYYYFNSYGFGVARAKNPAGPYTDLTPDGPIINGHDPCVLVDDDGQAYLYTQSPGQKWKKARAYYFEDDLIHLKKAEDGKNKCIDFKIGEGTFPGEGIDVFKRNGLYYFTYCVGKEQQFDKIEYQMSTNATGPFEFKGTLLKRPFNGNIQGDVVFFKGQWVLIYHVWENWTERIAASLLHFNSDGTIQQVEYSHEGVGDIFESSNAILTEKK